MPGEMAVLPGDNDSVAVVRVQDGSASSEDIAVFTRGLMRPDRVVVSPSIRLAFSATSDRLYGVGYQGVSRMTVSGTGVSLIDLTQGLLPSESGIRFDSGRIYADSGTVLDAETLQIVGTFPRTPSSYSGRQVLPDAAAGVAYSLEPVNAGSVLSLFSTTLFTQSRAVSLPIYPSTGSSSAPQSFVLTAPGRVAFRSSSGLVVLYSFDTPVLHTLNVNTSGGVGAVPVTFSPSDASGQGAGSTPVSRTYATSSRVAVSVPAAANGAVFTRWQNGYTTLGTSPTLDIAVTGSLTLTAVYTYPAPTVDFVEPASGLSTGGTTVTVRGTGFRPGATVSFGGSLGTGTVVVSDTEIRTITSSHAIGVVSVTVNNNGGGSSTRLNAYTYVGSFPYRRYFAEGAANWFFDSSFALMNPGQTPATVNLRFQRDDGQNFLHSLEIPAQGRRTVDAKQVPGLTPAGGFSTVVESDVEIVADRTMTWMSDGYGSHSESSLPGTATTWYLAEGATHSGFQLYYLIQNPNATAATFTITYLRAAGQPPIIKTYSGANAVQPMSRKTILVNAEDAGLASAEVSAVITSPSPIIVERAMYLDTKGKFFGAGHASAGVVTPSTDWFLAEGATGYFDEFILIANPTDQSANVEVTYLLTGGGTLTRTLTVPAKSRQNIFVNWEQGNGISLANTSVSARVRSTNNIPIIVERAMWWPSGGFTGTWLEAHNSVGATQTGTLWGLADGQQGGSPNWDTYILVANTSAFAGRVRVTLLFDDDTTASTELDLAANSRTTVFTGGNAVGPGVPFGGMANGKKFGALIESLPAAGGTAQIVVERAMYSDSGNTWWAAGTGTVGTRLR
jgi:hypothetical protein